MGVVILILVDIKVVEPLAVWQRINGSYVPEQQARLAHPWVTNQQQLEEVVTEGGIMNAFGRTKKKEGGERFLELDHLTPTSQQVSWFT